MHLFRSPALRNEKWREFFGEPTGNFFSRIGSWIRGLGGRGVEAGNITTYELIFPSIAKMSTFRDSGSQTFHGIIVGSA